MRHSGSCVLHRFAVSSEIITNYDILRFICEAIYDLPASFLSLSLSLKQKKYYYFYFFFCTGGDRKMLPASRSRGVALRGASASRLSLSSNFTFAYNGRRLDLDLVVAAQLCRTALTVCNDDFQTHSWASPVFLARLQSLSRIIISYFDLLFCLLFCNTFAAAVAAAAAADSLSFFWLLFFGNSFVVLAADPDPAWCAFLRFAPFLQLLCK